MESATRDSDATDSTRANSTRRALLESAKRLFTEKGYSAVSTRELAEHAGVNLGAITYHFGSKAKLFIETLVTLMAERKAELETFFLSSAAFTPEQAAQSLANCIESILYNMCHPVGPDACRMMHREINGATSHDPELYGPLLDSVTEKFIRPLDGYFLSLLKVLAPEKSERQQWYFVHSIIGQCVYYVTHRPFVEKLHGEDLVRKEKISEVAHHIAAFTLRAMQLDEKLIAVTLGEFEGDPEW